MQITSTIYLIILLLISLPLYAQDYRTESSKEVVSVIPAKISYQGVLTDNNGDPQNGTFTMTFGLFTTPTDGTALWSETQNSVQVTNGIFNLLLGNVNPINLAFDVGYYLNINVQGTNLLPRIELASSGYSFNTARIQGVPVSTTTPSTGQVLKYSGAQWLPGTDETTGGTAGGDLTGTYPDPTVAKIQGKIVSTSDPSSGQVLKWTSSQWAPGTDNTGSSLWNQSGSNIYYNSGNVGIGTSSPQELLYVAGGTMEVYPASDGQRGIRLRSADQNKNFILDMKNDGTMQIGSNSGVMQLASTFGVESRNLSGTWRPMSASSFDVQSSRSLKTNIKYLGESGTSYWLEQILRMKPANYIFNWQDESTQPQLGFIAEEMPEELKGQDGESVNLYALTSAGIVGIKGLYQMLQKQQAMIKDLQKEILALKGNGGQQ